MKKDFLTITPDNGGGVDRLQKFNQQFWVLYKQKFLFQL